MANSTIPRFLASILALANPIFSEPDRYSIRPVEAFASRTYYYAGGQYVNTILPGSTTTGQYMTGQIYVEHLIPHTVTKQYPVVFIAGNGQTVSFDNTSRGYLSFQDCQRLLNLAKLQIANSYMSVQGANFLQTPDGREGWASYFLRKGYEVYLTDQAHRGRSPYLPGDGQLTLFSTSSVERQFTAPQDFDPLPYPQASLHDQWPGTGRAGDPVFDIFYASQVPSQADQIKLAEYNNVSYSALLNRIGKPVIVLTHSQAGPFGWQLADARPDLVRAIIALEPQGPPFENWAGPPFAPGFSTTGGGRPFGLTVLPLVYDPPISSADMLGRLRLPAANDSVSDCIVQAAPARVLVNLAKIPILLVTAEASYHTVYDYCTVGFLTQAGSNVQHVQLGDVGIHGSGHFMFLEKNSLATVEQVVVPWIAKLGH